MESLEKKFIAFLRYIASLDVSQINQEVGIAFCSSKLKTGTLPCGCFGAHAAAFVDIQGYDSDDDSIPTYYYKDGFEWLQYCFNDINGLLASTCDRIAQDYFVKIDGIDLNLHRNIDFFENTEWPYPAQDVAKKILECLDNEEYSYSDLQCKFNY